MDGHSLVQLDVTVWGLSFQVCLGLDNYLSTALYTTCIRIYEVERNIPEGSISHDSSGIYHNRAKIPPAQLQRAAFHPQLVELRTLWPESQALHHNYPLKGWICVAIAIVLRAPTSWRFHNCVGRTCGLRTARVTLPGCRKISRSSKVAISGDSLESHCTHPRTQTDLRWLARVADAF